MHDSGLYMLDGGMPINSTCLPATEKTVQYVCMLISFSSMHCGYVIYVKHVGFASFFD